VQRFGNIRPADKGRSVMGGLFSYPRAAPRQHRILRNWHIVVSYFECTERTHGMSGCGSTRQNRAHAAICPEPAKADDALTPLASIL
jgi:hypothetical protein